MVWARMTGPALRNSASMLGVRELRSREASGKPVSLVQNTILNSGTVAIIDISFLNKTMK